MKKVPAEIGDIKMCNVAGITTSVKGRSLVALKQQRPKGNKKT
jgi:hypothetical protein